MHAMEKDEKLADRVLQRLGELELTIPVLAEITGLKETTLRGIANGSQPTVTQEKLYRLARGLQTTMEWLTVGGVRQHAGDQVKELLPPREFALLKVFRRCNKTQKDFLEKYMDTFSTLSVRGPKKRPPSD